MRTHLAVPVPILLILATVAHGQPNPPPDPPEVQRLCRKWDGTLAIVLPGRPRHLRCEHIRVQFERTAKDGPIFRPIRQMIESVRNQNLLTVKAGDLPNDQKCSIERGTSTILTCTTLDFEPEISTQFFGTKSGVLMRAVVSADLDWYRKQATERIQKQYGVPPTPEFLQYYIELVASVSSFLGGANEQYSIEGDRLVLRLNLR